MTYLILNHKGIINLKNISKIEQNDNNEIFFYHYETLKDINFSIKKMTMMNILQNFKI